MLSLPITIIGANFDELYRDMKKSQLEKRARQARLASSAGRSHSPQLGSTKRLGMTFTPATPAIDAPNSPFARVNELIDAAQERLSKQARGP